MPTDALKPSRLALAASLALLVGVPAWAQQSPYTLSVTQGFTRDSNVLRAPADQAEADTISSTTLGFSLDQPIGRQRVKAEADLQANRFHQDSSLDNNAPTLKAEWDWEAGDHWQGELGGSHVKSLYRYNLSDNTVVLGRNIQTENQQFFRARLGVVTAWTLETGWAGYQRSYTADQYRNQDLSRNTASVGVRYQPQPDLSARFNLRHSDGRYPHYSSTLGADDYTRWDVEALLSIRMSAASQVDVRVAHTNEAHSQPTATGGPHWTGSAGWQWQPTGKLSFSTKVLRDSDTSDQTLGDGLVNSQNKLTTRLDLSAQWTVTDKVQLGMSYQQSMRQLEHTISGVGSLNGRDRARTVALQLGYQPMQALNLGCNASREVRDVSGDTDLSYPYQANVFSCYGQLNWR